MKFSLKKKGSNPGRVEKPIIHSTNIKEATPVLTFDDLTPLKKIIPINPPEGFVYDEHISVREFGWAMLRGMGLEDKYTQ